MTIAALTGGRAQIAGDGVTDRVDLDFQFVDEEDLLVIHTDTSGTDTEWTYQQAPGNWSFTGGAYETGTVFFTASDLAAGERLTVTLVSTYEQPFTLEGGEIDPEIIERSMDRTALSVQAIAGQVSRSLSVSPSLEGTLPDLEVPDLPDGYGFVRQGNALVPALIDSAAISEAVSDAQLAQSAAETAATNAGDHASAASTAAGAVSAAATGASEAQAAAEAAQSGAEAAKEDAEAAATSAGTAAADAIAAYSAALAQVEANITALEATVAAQRVLVDSGDLTGLASFTLDMSAQIAAGYTRFWLRFDGEVDTDNTDVSATFSDDGGNSWLTSHYMWSSMRGFASGSSGSGGGNGSSSDTEITLAIGIGNATNEGIEAEGNITFLNGKAVINLEVTDRQYNNPSITWLVRGVCVAEDLDAVLISLNTGAFINGSFKLIAELDPS